MPKAPRMRIKTDKIGLNDQDVELEQVDDNTQEGCMISIVCEEDAEPNLVKTSDGRLLIEMKLKENHVCANCKQTFVSKSELLKHKSTCVNTLEEFEDTLHKEKIAAQNAQPGEEFFKYCNPNPDHPCYCCGEDISTAHVGHIKCKLCPKSFKAFEYMEKHLATVHAEITDFACYECNAQCPTQEILDIHLQTHGEGKPFSCVRCGKDFTRKYHLERHLNHSSCGDTPKTKLPCEVCGKVFTRLDNLREHLRFHLGQGSRKRDYQCPYCEKSFYGSSLLNIHIRTHTGEKPFPCDLCSKSFPSTGALRKHRRSHTGERPYRCDQCAATFAARETLNRHRKTHTGDKPHECSVCGKRFIQATQLKAHLFHHTGENGFDCTMCSSSFNRKNRLQEHIRYVHNNEKPQQCEVCSKEFTRKEDLMRHMNTHKETKDFACPQCDKRFVTKLACKTHQRTHEVEEPVMCTLCENTFKRKDCLLRHMRSKHREHVVALKELEKYTAENSPKETTTPSNKVPSEAKPVPLSEVLPNLPKKDEVLEIGGEVFEITPVEEIQIVKISSKTVNTETENSREIKIMEVVEIKPGNCSSEIGPSTLNKTAAVIPPGPPIPKASILPPSRASKTVPRERKRRKRVPGAMRAELMETKIKIEHDDSIPIFLSDEVLKIKISELLRLLIDEDTLVEFGWPTAPTEEVLSNVIIRCGHKPASDQDTGDCTTRMRENTKILFSLTMDDDNIKSLLNNHTVDEVIMNVLKNQ